MKLLIASNDELIRKSLSHFLTFNKFPVDTFHNGNDAIDAISNNEYGALIISSNTDGLNGLEITSYVRKNLNLQTPIIFVCPSNSSEVEKSALELEVNTFMSLPINPKKLLSYIN